MKKPLIIGIGGAHSSCGKTSVAVALMKCLTGQNRKVTGPPDASELQVSETRNPEAAGPFSSLITHHSSLLTGHPSLFTLTRWGAIKYTRTDLYACLVDDREALNLKGKDTGRLLDAGADEVLWIQSPPSELGEVLPIALDRLSHLDGIIVEGNSAIEFIGPDIVIFVSGSSQKHAKASARSVLNKAGIIVLPEGGATPPGVIDEGDAQRAGSLPAPVVLQAGPLAEGFDGSLAQRLITIMDTILKRERIEQLLKERSEDGRISCPAARRIAEELGVSYSDVGSSANALKIKIRECELGCF